MTKLKKKELNKLLLKLRTGKLSHQVSVKIINLLGDNNFLEAKEDIAKYLFSKYYLERYAALSNLIYDFGLDECRKNCEFFLLKDKDDDNRALGANCLAILRVGTNDKPALKLLLKVFKNKKESRIVRDSAFDSILHIMGIPYRKRPKLPSRLNYKSKTYMNFIEEAQRIISKSGSDNTKQKIDYDLVLR